MSLLASSPTVNCRMLGLGHYQPANVVTNEDLIRRGVETTDEWIRSRVGVAARRYADPDETVVDMAAVAGGKAIANSGVSPAEVDLVIVATCTMPTPMPIAAAQTATRLGVDAPGAYDLNSACAGFVYALAAGCSAVQTGQARNVLVIAAERYSGWLDFTDRASCIIFGDGAGAVVIGRSEDNGFGPIAWGSDGSQADAITINEQTRFFGQDGPRVYRWATTKIAPTALRACRLAGVGVSELAGFVPHQANLRIIEPLAKQIGITDAIVARDIVESGNTSAASIPLALSKLVERGELPSRAPVLVVGFGAGLTYAAQVVLTP